MLSIGVIVLISLFQNQKKKWLEVIANKIQSHHSAYIPCGIRQELGEVQLGDSILSYLQFTRKKTRKSSTENRSVRPTICVTSLNLFVEQQIAKLGSFLLEGHTLLSTYVLEQDKRNISSEHPTQDSSGVGTHA